MLVLSLDPLLDHWLDQLLDHQLDPLLGHWLDQMFAEGPRIGRRQAVHFPFLIANRLIAN